MSASNSKKQPVVATNDVTGEIKEFSSVPSLFFFSIYYKKKREGINKAAKFVGASLAHVARCLVKDKEYKGKGYTIVRISE